MSKGVELLTGTQGSSLVAIPLKTNTCFSSSQQQSAVYRGGAGPHKPAVCDLKVDRSSSEQAQYGCLSRCEFMVPQHSYLPLLQPFHSLLCNVPEPWRVLQKFLLGLDMQQSLILPSLLLTVELLMEAECSICPLRQQSRPQHILVRNKTSKVLISFKSLQMTVGDFSFLG